MSLPKHKTKVLHRLFKPGLVKRREGRLGAAKRGSKRSKNSKKTSTKRKQKEVEEESAQNLYTKAGTTVSDESGVVHSSKDENGVNSVLRSLYENLLKLDKNAYFGYATANIRRDKRKSDKLGTNPNELPPFSGAVGASSFEDGTWLRDVFLTQTDEEALRRKVLERVDELDPLMCLPKVLCGYSHRRRHQYEYYSTTTSTTRRPAVGENLLDQYLHLLKIIGPT